MGATLKVNEGTREMIRLVGDQLVQEAFQRNLYIVPPKGEYEFMITGYAPPFELKRDPQYITKDNPSEYQTMTNLECTITDGKGKGKMFTVMLGFSIGQRSNLGKVLRGFGVDLSPNDRGEWDLDRAIGYVGKAHIVPSDALDENNKPKYTRFAFDMGFEPVSAPDRSYSIQIETREPELAAVNGNGNHAASDDGWE